MKYTEDEVQRARDYPVVRLLGLAENGRRQECKCPFHNERRPSFSVFVDNSFKCFGCGVQGQNAVDFVMKLMGCSFTEAIGELLEYKD